MDLRPVVAPDELDTCIDIWLRAMNDLGEKQGDAPMSAADVEWLPPSLAHLARTDPSRFLIAVREGATIAFGCAFERDDFWFLSELMVVPEAQGEGIGTSLLEALLPDPIRRRGMTLATVVESRQPVSTFLYARYGMAPRLPIYWMDGIGDLQALPALPEGVTAQPLDEGSHTQAVAELDRTLLGYSRPQDHLMFAAESERAWAFFSPGGDLVGYGYVQPGGWVSPAAAKDEGFTAGILRHLVEADQVAADKLTVQVGGAGALLPMMARACMRSQEGAQLIYCSSGRVPPPGYLHFGGYQP